MTEKKQPLPPRPDQTQSFHYPTEDEISLADLLEVLVRKKVLILAATSICTLFSILYAQSITPTYRATIEFLEPQETFFALLPYDVRKNVPGGIAAEHEKNKSYVKPTIFAMFLSKITSFKFQEEVYKNGDFLKKFHGKGSAIDIENFVLRIHNSIRISKEKADIEMPDFEMPVSLEMDGPKPKVMSEFLNTLAESAKQATVNEIKDMISLIVNNEIIEISREIDILRSVVEEKNMTDKAVFSEALRIAKNLGVKNNNFDKLKSSNIDVGVSSQARTSLDLRSAALESFLDSQEKTTIKVQDTTLPAWYLYGEKALQQELDAISFRKKEVPIPGVSLKNISLMKYRSVNPSSLEIKVVSISQSSIPPSSPIKPNKKMIIAVGIGLGFFIGIFMAFMRNSLALIEKRDTLSTPTTE